MTTPLIELRQVSFGYDARPVLLDVDLDIQPSSFIGILGPSGTGKTTQLRAILGQIRPQRGSITRASGTAVSYVPQLETVNWNFPVTVGQCVLMSRIGKRLVPWASPAERRLVTQVLDRLGIADLQDRHIRDLSGGQQQRMFIARALLRDPSLLLLDEPTSGVDVATRHEVLHLLQDLNSDGIAIILTTHDLNGLAAHLPELVALRTRILARGTPEEVVKPWVLEQVFGARMEVLQHLGMPVVVDPFAADRRAG